MRHMSFFCPVDVAEAHEATGSSSEDVLPVSRLQDERAARHSVHHRTLHQLCHRHDAELRHPRPALDQERSRSALSAQLVAAALFQDQYVNKKSNTKRQSAVFLHHETFNTIRSIYQPALFKIRSKMWEVPQENPDIPLHGEDP